MVTCGVGGRDGAPPVVPVPVALRLKTRLVFPNALVAGATPPSVVRRVAVGRGAASCFATSRAAVPKSTNGASVDRRVGRDKGQVKVDTPKR